MRRVLQCGFIVLLWNVGLAALKVSLGQKHLVPEHDHDLWSSGRFHRGLVGEGLQSLQALCVWAVQYT